MLLVSQWRITRPRLGACGVSFYRAVARGDPQRAETAPDYAALRRLDDVAVLATDQGCVADAEHEEREEVGAPEADVQLEQSGGDGGDGAHVDTADTSVSTNSPTQTNMVYTYHI